MDQDDLIRDRIKACLLGGAVGDALGAPIEFASLDQIRRAHGAAGVTEFLPAYGRLGAITDDTQMTLFTAEGLLRAHVQSTLEGRSHTPSVVHHAYLRWLATQSGAVAHRVALQKDWPDGWLISDRRLWQQRAPGNTCLSALSDRGADLGDAAANNSKGCGTIMRVAPVGLVTRARDGSGISSVYDLGAAVSRVTHGHPAGYISGGAFAVLIALLIEGISLDIALDRMEVVVRGVPGSNVVTRAIEAMRGLLAEVGDATPERIERLGGGWVAEEALVIAIYCALKADSFEHGVRLAVNHSGDSDSTGSLVGQILGSIGGTKVIPARWLADLELRDLIEHVAVDLANLRSGTFDVEAELTRYPGS